MWLLLLTMLLAPRNDGRTMFMVCLLVLLEYGLTG
jgi:hypothetical protein